MSIDERVTREIAASTADVWSLVADLPRMGDWSGENTGGSWLDGATGPSAGATFRGANRNGFRRWSTKVTIDECVLPTRLSFQSAAMGLPMAQWSYDLEETPEGCKVTESWTDLRPGFFKPVSAVVSGVRDRASFARDQMTVTLERVAAAAESGAEPFSE